VRLNSLGFKQGPSDDCYNTDFEYTSTARPVTNERRSNTVFNEAPDAKGGLTPVPVAANVQQGTVPTQQPRVGYASNHG